jgi:BirA family biotin operon repressor/biotin-[acetyl-CoA-carboxylase] ligase
MIGRPRVHHRRADSTNQRAKELAAAGAPHGTLVTAAEQTAGRGRQGRTWLAPPGSAILMSLVVRGAGEAYALLPLATALAVSEACEEHAPVECAIKWPNDVWIDRRKVAGILLEGRPQEGWAVIGVGLNVSTAEEELPEELRDTATSLVAAGAEDIDKEAVLATVLARLGDWLAAKPVEVITAWSHRDALLGDRIRWNGGEGVAAGIDDSGALLVDTDDGRVSLDAGEVHLKR